jgi:hypothetical protein
MIPLLPACHLATLSIMQLPRVLFTLSFASSRFAAAVAFPRQSVPSWRLLESVKAEMPQQLEDPAARSEPRREVDGESQVVVDLKIPRPIGEPIPVAYRLLRSDAWRGFTEPGSPPP